MAESNDLAESQAKSVAERFWTQAESGFPFGMAECEECGASAEDDCAHDREPASAYDYLSDVLGIDYVVSGQGEYRGAEVLVGFGGPNVWIDTRSRELVVAWCSAPVRRSLPGAMIAELDSALEELWSTR